MKVTNVPTGFPGGDEAREVQHSVDMLVDLIPDTDDPSYPDRVQRACRESFAVNARLLIAFLTHEGDPRDICATDFAPGWTVLPRTKRKADPNWLQQQWSWASERVAHFGKVRTADMSYNVDPSKLRILAGSILDEIDRWVTEVEAARHPDAPALRSSVDAAKARL